MTFEWWIVALCARFLSQRTFELVVEPALADLEFEQALGRRSRIASHAAVLRAIVGGMRHDMQRGSGGFFKLTLLSACYYLFPVAVSVRIFKTWPGLILAGQRTMAGTR